jgi:CubicO group peptidase (beta-lactamase class C family)
MSLKAPISASLSRGCQAGEVPGVVVMLGDRRQTIYAGATGHRVLARPSPMNLATVARTASMQLVEAGQLDLAIPAADLVPDVSSIKVLFSLNQPQRVRPRGRPGGGQEGRGSIHGGL